MAAITVGLLILIGLSCCSAGGYQSEALKLHNQYRAKHHAPAMRLDNQLNRNAARCAHYYARRGTNDHSCPYKNGAGENLSWLVRSSGPPSEADAARRATIMWYNEVKYYDYNRPGFSLKTGHFTQVVWKSSTKFGIGVYRDPASRRAYVCALYSQRGNTRGRFQQNVRSP